MRARALGGGLVKCAQLKKIITHLVDGLDVTLGRRKFQRGGGMNLSPKCPRVEVRLI